MYISVRNGSSPNKIQTPQMLEYYQLSNMNQNVNMTPKKCMKFWKKTSSVNMSETPSKSIKNSKAKKAMKEYTAAWKDFLKRLLVRTFLPPYTRMFREHLSQFCCGFGWYRSSKWSFASSQELPAEGWFEWWWGWTSGARGSLDAHPGTSEIALPF